jgi:transposase-like protein
MPSPKNRRPRQFSPSFKAQIVAACQQPGASVARVSQAHAINANIVHRWLREHQHGVQWYDMTGRQPRKGYTAEFKRRIVEQCLQPGARVTEVACAHHISANTVHEWVATRRAQTPEIDD